MTSREKVSWQAGEYTPSRVQHSEGNWRMIPFRVIVLLKYNLFALTE